MHKSTNLLASSIQTTSDLMSIALQAEREAIRRYSHLAGLMHEGNNQSTAALFERMVVEEQEHERLLLEWMAQEDIHENPEIAPVTWRDPKISTTYDDEARDPQYSSPYKALAFAVHNEEIAFRFYTHVVAESKNTSVRKYAEILAREELGHAALLRTERRRAYHAERANNIIEPRLDPRTIYNEADLLAAAIHLDRLLANGIDIIASESPEIETLANDVREEIANNENRQNEIASPGEDIIRDLEQVDLYNAQMDKILNDSNAKLKQLRACCDRSFAFYDAIVEIASDEKIMLTAQRLTSTALDRISILKKFYGNMDISNVHDNEEGIH